MGITIEFKTDTAFIDIGNSDISGEYVTSPNGRYFMICNTLYVPSGNDKEYAFVFTKDEVCYKKLIPNDEGGEWWCVFDDGQSLILTSDNALIKLDATGKQQSKRKAPNIDTDTVGITGATFYGIGNDNEGLTLLFLYDLESNQTITKTIPDIEYTIVDDEGDKEIGTLLSSDTEMLFTGGKFVFVYENGVDAVALDLNGQPVECLECDIAAVNEKRVQKEIAYRKQRAMSSYEYWLGRLVRDKAAGKDVAEIKKAELKVTEYKELLRELGVEISEPVVQPTAEFAPPPPAPTPKKKSFLERLFGK